MSSKTAIITLPASLGVMENSTPRATNLSYSAFTSSTANDVQGIPASFNESWYCLAGSKAIGSSRSSTPDCSCGDTTVNHLCSPSGTSVFLINPEYWYRNPVLCLGLQREHLLRRFSLRTTFNCWEQQKNNQKAVTILILYCFSESVESVLFYRLYFVKPILCTINRVLYS